MGVSNLIKRERNGPRKGLNRSLFILHKAIFVLPVVLVMELVFGHQGTLFLKETAKKDDTGGEMYRKIEKR
ncbi:hypothetical protein YDYSY3_43210 [Paenibacillus chitinolyticus]|uniref:hypothetical protein n=1 Tax=Paenibacillus chitinolyticus TaxID=79263 RepID=UPI0026E503E6|nr:hypothetical protein [Paenibacillus chitinolyticus]GKS13321.1 hypothetical protein YDYSY3_43210 [Paenibacillus chitinolyticus]